MNDFYPGMSWSGFGGLVLDPKAAGLPENAKGVVWWLINDELMTN